MDSAVRVRVDASDVVQDAMIEAFERIDSFFDGVPQPVFLWLRYLTLQRLLQVRRFHVDAQRRDARSEVRLAATSRADLAERLTESATSPSGVFARKEKRAALLRALEALADADREILVLRCLEELSNAEAAGVLGLNETTASSRFVRALARAQQLLAGG
jgi:RNA polymerase sigma-70 factor (ECF subfamily)